MTRGQITTVFTLAFSVTVGLISVVSGAIVLFYRPAYTHVALYLGAGKIPPLWLGPILAGAGIIAASGLFQFQQWLSRRFADREIAKLKSAFRDVEYALGTEKAEVFLRYKLRQIFESADRSKIDLFRTAEVDRFVARLREMD
jgi:hypothetical protein